MKERKIMAYKMHLENPYMAQEEIADAMGCTRRSVINWFNEIKDVIENGKKG